MNKENQLTKEQFDEAVSTFIEFSKNSDNSQLELRLKILQKMSKYSGEIVSAINSIDWEGLFEKLDQLKSAVNAIQSEHSQKVTNSFPSGGVIMTEPPKKVHFTEVEYIVSRRIGHFELFQSEKSGKYYFRLKSSNGQVILHSESYEKKAGAENGIASVKKNGVNGEQFDLKRSLAGDPYYTLKASNGQAIGRSECYSSETAALKGIESVKRNVSGPIKDLT